MTARLFSALVFPLTLFIAPAVGCSSGRPAFETSASPIETGGVGSSSTTAAQSVSSSTGATRGLGSASVTTAGGLSAGADQACGNGVLDGAEECDEGVRNGDTATSTCLSDCKVPYCGDGVVSSSEQCDDGPDNNDLLAGACRTNCEEPRCGDGVIDEPGADRCDEGAANSDTQPNACRTNCFVPKCGDGVRDVGETCDLGSANNSSPGSADGCTAECRSALCGNGQTDAGEECDDGPANDDSTPGACRTSCQKATCGDGVIDPAEACDDGKNNSDTQPDQCRTDCTEPTCGDGVKDDDEDCDGEQGCDSQCKAPGCGDGVVQEGVEECDDGELAGEYGGCAAGCRLGPHCGDGQVAPEEECDDGADNRDGAYGVCRTNCKFGERCGDGVVQAQEECDGGGDCNDSCQFGDCSSGQLRCGSEATCVDPATHGQFCGASGDCQGDNDGQVCPSGSQCTGGRCQCPNQGVICDSRCIDPKSDNQFCGATDNCAGDDKNGTPCASGTQCEDGQCLPQCNSSQQRCGDRCIPKEGCCEPDSCPSGQECTESNVCECTGGKVTCGDQCLPDGQCCDEDDCDPGFSCKDNSCVETDPPAVTSVNPSDGQTGVVYDAVIVVTFDEPMDEDSVETATTLTGSFSPGTLAFSWNSTSTELRITPSNGFTYKSGTTPTVEPYRYELTIGTGAKDKTGNAMASAFGADFTTRRNITQDFPASVALTNTYGPAIEANVLPTACSGSGTGGVGWWTSPGNGGQYYLFAEINAQSLWDVDDVELISASFNATQSAPTGDFYVDQAGTVQLAQVVTEGTSLIYHDLYLARVYAELGTFSFNDASVLQKDITQRFTQDFNSDLLYMVFRLAYGGEPPNNAKANFSCGSIKLVVVYSIP